MLTSARPSVFAMSWVRLEHFVGVGRLSAGETQALFGGLITHSAAIRSSGFAHLGAERSDHSARRIAFISWASSRRRNVCCVSSSVLR